jgi:probable HAF family extracellular repeat protein
MKKNLAGMFAIGLLANTTQLPAQTYTLTDLGAVPPETVSQGYGLNSAGQAAGTSSNPNGAIATLFSDRRAIDLGLLEANDVSVAAGINASAEVVGFEYFSSTAANTPHAWVFSSGELLDIHSPSLFPAGTKAFGINASGVVVGQGYLTSSSFHVFVYENGQMVDIGPPGSFQANPVAINDAGEILGSYYTSSTDNGQFLYSNGKFTKLAAGPAGTSTSASAINSVGVIVGSISVNGLSHAALYSNGVWTDLGTLPGATAGTAATGINTAGQVIAVASYRVTSYHPFIPAKTVACVIQNGAVVDLNTLIPPNTGFNLSRAIAINDAGQILCNTKTQIGTRVSNQRAVLLTPK